MVGAETRTKTRTRLSLDWREKGREGTGGWGAELTKSGQNAKLVLGTMGGPQRVLR